MIIRLDLLIGGLVFLIGVLAYKTIDALLADWGLDSLWMLVLTLIVVELYLFLQFRLKAKNIMLAIGAAIILLSLWGWSA